MSTAPYAAAQDADALLILNDWSEFAELDLAQLHYTLRYPIVIDGRNLYDPEKMTEHGFTYLSVGRPGLSQPIDPIGIPSSKVEGERKGVGSFRSVGKTLVSASDGVRGVSENCSG